MVRMNFNNSLVDAKVLLIEPFYGGSHKQLMDLLVRSFDGCVLFSLPAKKWHWKARTSALCLSQVIPNDLAKCNTLFASSTLNLAELLALRPDMGRLKKVLYFHENQLVYPVRKQKNRDFQYGYNQILSCLVADVVVFNSNFNMDSFLGSIDSHLKFIPDHRPKHLVEQIRPKCRVLFFPVSTPAVPDLNVPGSTSAENNSMLNYSLVERLEPQLSNEQILHQKSCKALPKAETVGSLTSPSVNITCLNICCPSSPSEMLSFSTNVLPDEEAHEKHDSSLVNSTRSCIAGVLEPDDTLTEKPSTTVSSEEKSITSSLENHVFTETVLHIVWPHRWEHDKNPETFLNSLITLHNEGCQFCLSVLGETYTDVPEIFLLAKQQLSTHIMNWGYAETKEQYVTILKQADVAVSTAFHEFYGVAMLEAAMAECFPLCPKRLVYPEIFPEECLYNTDAQLLKKLRQFCKRPHLAKQKAAKIQLHWNRFKWPLLEQPFKELLFN